MYGSRAYFEAAMLPACQEGRLRARTVKNRRNRWVQSSTLTDVPHTNVCAISDGAVSLVAPGSSTFDK